MSLASPVSPGFSAPQLHDAPRIAIHGQPVPLDRFFDLESCQQFRKPFAAVMSQQRAFGQAERSIPAPFL